MNAVLARRVLRLLPQPGGELPAGVTCGRLARLVEEILGDTIERYPDGRMLIWGIARHDGYNIPEYPMAGCGDVREFLEDEGARNVPDWYERHLGISREDYDAIWKYELVMVRNQARLSGSHCGVPAGVIPWWSISRGAALLAHIRPGQRERVRRPPAF